MMLFDSLFNIVKPYLTSICLGFSQVVILLPNKNIYCCIPKLWPFENLNEFFHFRAEFL